MELSGVKDIAIYGTDCVAEITHGKCADARFISAKEKYFDIAVEDGTLTVRQKSRNFFSRIIMHRIEFKLVLPVDFKGKLRFRNKNGGLYMDGGNYTEVELSASNGKFDVKNITCASLQLKTENGAVTAKNIDAAETVSLKCRNGGVKVESAQARELSVSSKNAALTVYDMTAKKVECQTSNGTIDANGISSDDIRLETSNGKICAAPLGSRDDYKLAIETDHGAVTVDGVAYKRIADVSHAAKRLDAKTANGDIDIRFV